MTIICKEPWTNVNTTKNEKNISPHFWTDVI